MKNYALIIGLAIPLFSGIANADVVQIQYTDKAGTPTVKSASPYYINPQTSFKAGVSAGLGRKIVAEVKDSNGVLVATKTKTRVESADTFIVKGVTYFGAEFDFENLADGKYTLTSIVYSASQEEMSRQTNDLFIDTQAPQIVGDFYWNPFGYYAHKHTDGRFIISRAGAADAGFPSISVGASGFSHATFSSEFLDGPKAGSFHAKDTPALLTGQGKLVIGTGAPNSMTSIQIPDDTANQMRLTYTVFNKVGVSTSKSVDVYVATKRGEKPEPYGLYTGVSSKLDGVNAFTGFVPYVAKMTIPGNPVRMLYRAPKDLYVGGGGTAEIYGGWLNGSRGPNKVVHTDAQYIYFDITGSTDGKQFSALHHFTRDVSTWRTHLLTHDVTIPAGMEPPKPVEHSFFIQGRNEWRNSNVIQYITKSDTGGTNDVISKIKLVVEPRSYDQRFSYDYGYINSAYKGFCIIPAGDTECVMTTSLPYPADDVHHYSQRSAVTDIANTLFGPELNSTWQYDGSIAQVDPATVSNDPISKTVSFGFINKFSDRLSGGSTIRVLDAFAVNSQGVKTKLTRTQFTTRALNASEQLASGTFQYASLPDGIYDIEAYVEDGFGVGGITNKNTHQLFTNIAIDNAAPKIITNIKNQTVDSLPAVAINVSDTSAVKIKNVVLTGGIDNVNIALPIVTTGSNSFRPEHVYIRPSKTNLYTMTIIAEDAFGNQSSKIETFNYVPNIVELPDIKQPAISAALKSENGLPSNVIKTPQIKNKLGEFAVGNHDVVFTLLPTAGSAMVVNGETVSPGESREFTVNLSKTDHRLIFEAYPAVSGQEVTNQYEINLSEIKVSLCPDTFSLKSGECIHLSFTDPLLKCNHPYSLSDGQCQMEVLYDPSTTCLSGYALDGTTCRGTFSVSPLTVCPTGYSQVDDKTCKEIKTFPLSVCPNGATEEEGFCKASDGKTTPQKSYCQGKDISAGSFCDAGTCYDYKKDWNACQVSTTLPSTEVCQVGSLSSGKCQVTDQYQLNMQCPFGYNRDGLVCKRIEIIPPIKSCEAGYELSGNICTKTEVSPFVSCPATHHLLDGRCHEKANIKINCPSTFTWDGTQCTKNEQKPAVPLCQAGFTHNGTTCQKIDVMDATIICPANFYVENGRCTNKATNGATPVCPAGYSWDQPNEICKKTETQSATPSCPAGQTLDGTICKKAETVSANGNCSAAMIAAGYSWDGSTCKKQVTKSATPSCTSGYTWNGTNCEKNDSQTATTSCPAGFTWNGTTCSKDESQAATPACTSGFTWNGTTCSKTNTQAATPSCTSGFTWNGSTCAKSETQPATSACASGFTWNGSTCSKDESQAATRTCPAGYTWNGTECSLTATMSATRYCPAGYTLIGTSCRRTDSQSATTSCPSGWVFNGLNCVSFEETPATQTCNTGFTWNGTNCAKVDSQNATPSCSSGFTWNGTTCARTNTQAATPSCASGFTWNGSTCAKTESQSATPSCTSGFTWNGSTCSKTESQSATPSCTSGFTWNGSTCSRTEAQSASPVCASGFTFNAGAGLCVKLESQLATQTCAPSRSWTAFDPQTDGTAYCESNLVASGNLLGGNCYYGNKPACEVQGNCVSQGIPTNDPCETGSMDSYNSTSCPSGWVPSGSSCQRLVSQAPSSYQCSSGWTLSSTSCSRTETSAATFSCSSGWTLSGSNCNRTVNDTPTFSCSSGWTLSGTNCNRTVNDTPTFSCSSGWTLAGSNCNQTQTATPTYNCPSGWTLSGTSCNRTLTETATLSCPNAAWSLFGGICRRSLEQPPTYSCQSGWTLSGTICTRVSVIPTLMRCNSGWSLTGSICSTTVTTAPTYSCSSGWTLSGTNCNRTVTEGPTFSCSSGWTLSGSNCNRTVNDTPTYSCSSGWTLAGSNCNQTQTATPTYSCSSGWTLSGTNCNRTVTATAIITCPSGWTVNGNLCNTTTYLQPTYSCPPADGSLSGSNCVKTLTEPTEFSCPSTGGWSLSGSNCNRTVTSPAVYSCPSTGGWTLTGTSCGRTLTEAPSSYVCDPGQELSGQTCNTYTYKDPDAYQCPQSWTLDDKSCRLTTLSPVTGYQCDPDWNLDGQTCRIIRYEAETRTCAATQSKLNNTTCYENVPSTSVGDCPAGFVSNVTNCTKALTQPVILSCNQSYELIAQQCHTTLVQDVNVQCQTGEENRNGKCVVVKKHTPRPVCESPFLLDASKCKNEVTVPALD